MHTEAQTQNCASLKNTGEFAAMSTIPGSIMLCMKANFGFFRVVSAMALGLAVPLSLLAQEKKPETAPTAAVSDAGLDLAAELSIGRALFLRCLCKGESLSFDANGQPEGKSQPVDWTLAGVDVARVKRTGPERIELDGTRATVRWNDYNKNFDRKNLKLEPVRIVVNGAADAASVKRAMAAIFSQGMDRSFQASTPPYWQHYFDPTLPWPAEPLRGTIFRAGDKVGGAEVPVPAVAKKSSASYTEEAQRDRVEGPVTLQVIVDTSGAKHHVRVVTPLGYGLDAAAVATIEKTQFTPALVGGQPATVMFYLKENFSIVAPLQ